MAESVKVKNFRALSRAFDRADKALRREYKKMLRKVGEPVAHTAESLAGSRIRNASRGNVNWRKMRVVATSRLVYVAPSRRKTKVATRRRKNFGDLLMARAMLPALEHEKPHVEREFDHLIDRVGKEWEHGR